MLTSRRSALAIAAVVDIALHARPTPVRSRQLAERHDLAPRHLEPLLQALVRHGILKGVRGPRGGYELARERRRVTAGDVVRAALSVGGEEGPPATLASPLVAQVVGLVVREATAAYLAVLDGVTVADLCRRAETAQDAARSETSDFTI